MTKHRIDRRAALGLIGGTVAASVAAPRRGSAQSLDKVSYQTNWRATVVASLFWPETTRFEVVPWPERVFHGRYPAPGAKPDPSLFGRRRRFKDSDRIPIPPDYATELIGVMNALVWPLLARLTLRLMILTAGLLALVLFRHAATRAVSTGDLLRATP